MSQQSTSADSPNPEDKRTICTRVEFDCEVCGAHMSKWWHPNMPGRPRFCSRKCKSEFQRRAKPVTREWLEEKYVKEGLDCTQIGKLVGRNSKSVWSWLKDFGIPTRPPGFTVSSETRQKIREARIREGRVPYLRNGQHWMKGIEKSQHPSWRGGITPERQAFNATPEWKKARREVYKRDNRTCQRCGRVKRPYVDAYAFDIHHIVPFECVELRAVVSNLILLCEDCHHWVHSNENTKGEFILPCPPSTK